MEEVDDESVDVVVCTLVLCSVANMRRVLQEVRRILKTGGASYFLEHVVSDPSSCTYFLQHVFEPLWYYLGDGCMVTRATWKDLEQGWANFLTCGPHSVQKCDRGAGPGAFGHAM
ncbi:thiol S-methyltransferase TMT1B-like [Pseudoliparis swirei]|uniref:thiol S-methyltransferase TMT1B-like n=1 Tax=Pseudoliparis swirei TaxID=2059687 RepID=UPI0024BE6BF3|nr:thiol S-methyltransferase TMT1B-like [Pseudoliparis swirei]